jgi:hypothetical protein
VEGHSEHGHRIKVSDSDWDPPLSVAVTETVSVVPPSGGVVVAVAENVAVEDPAGTFTEAGTGNAGLLAETDTLMPPAGAWAERVRVQVEDAPASSVVALHANPETSTGASRLRVVLWEALLSVAVMVAAWVVLMVPRLAANVADALLTGTVTDAGTVSAVLLLESPTVLPPLGVVWVRVTVQVLEAPEFTLVGLQTSADTRVGATRLNEAVWEEALRAAVTVAVWVVVIVPRLALKVADALFAGTVADAGTVNAGLLLESPTALPPLGAA